MSLAAGGESLASPRDGRGAPPARRDDREYREYLSEEQRSRRGCIARRMQPDFHHGLLVLLQLIRSTRWRRMDDSGRRYTIFRARVSGSASAGFARCPLRTVAMALRSRTSPDTDAPPPDATRPTARPQGCKARRTTSSRVAVPAASARSLRLRDPDAGGPPRAHWSPVRVADRALARARRRGLRPADSLPACHRP